MQDPDRSRRGMKRIIVDGLPVSRRTSPKLFIELGLPSSCWHLSCMVLLKNFLILKMRRRWFGGLTDAYHHESHAFADYGIRMERPGVSRMVLHHSRYGQYCGMERGRCSAAKSNILSVCATMTRCNEREYAFSDFW